MTASTTNSASFTAWARSAVVVMRSMAGSTACLWSNSVPGHQIQVGADIFYCGIEHVGFDIRKTDRKSLKSENLGDTMPHQTGTDDRNLFHLLCPLFAIPRCSRHPLTELRRS